MPLFSIEDLQNEMNNKIKYTRKKNIDALKVLEKFTDIFTIVNGQVYLSVNLYKILKLKYIDSINTNFIKICEICKYPDIDTDLVHDMNYMDMDDDVVFLKTYDTLMGKKHEYRYEYCINDEWEFGSITMTHDQIKYYYNDWVKINNGVLNGEKMETFDQILDKIFGEHINKYLYHVKVHKDELREKINEIKDEQDYTEYMCELYQSSSY